MNDQHDLFGRASVLAAATAFVVMCSTLVVPSSVGAIADGASESDTRTAVVRSESADDPGGDGGDPAFGAADELAIVSDTLVSLSPARFVDTRPDGFTVDGEFAAAGVRGAGTEFEVQIAGRGSVPEGAEGVVVNFTAVNPDDGGFLTVHPCVEPRPLASSLNYTQGVSLGNEVVAALSSSGSLCVYTDQVTHLTVDVVGYVPSGSQVVPLVPARLLDTRPGAEAIDGDLAGVGRLAAGSTTVVTVAGRGNVPSSGVSSVLVNVVAVDPTASGFVVVHACQPTVPSTSSLNHVAGVTRGNEILVALSAVGEICVFADQSTDLVIDVVGYVPVGTTVAAVAPARLADSRIDAPTVDGIDEGFGRFEAGTERVLQVTGRAGVPADADAAVVNVTAIAPAGTGFFTVHPCGSPRPLASSLNYTTGVTGGNEIIAGLSADGALCVHTSEAAHIAVDLVGHLANSAAPQADISIAMTGSVDPVPVGDDLTYTVTVTNAGPASAENVRVTATLPTDVTMVSTTGCTEDPAGGPTCTLESIASGASKQVTIVASVSPAAIGDLTATATVMSDTGDPVATNNSTSLATTTVARRADLSITKTDSVDPVIPGEPVTYTVTVSNAGPQESVGVVVTDTLPTAVTFVSTSGCAEDPAGVPTCSLGTIASGASAEYTVVVTVDGGTFGTLANSVSVTAVTEDPDDTNDSTGESTDVAFQNDAPSFTAGADQTALEDAGAQTVVGWSTDISPGPTDEAAQIVSFAVTGNSNPSLFSAAPTVSADGMLTYTSALDANGTADITVVSSDDGGTANGGTDTSAPQTFSISVTPVNDAPSAVDNSFVSDASDPGGPSDRNAIGNTPLKVGVAAGAGPERVVTGSLLDGDTDVDADTLTVVAIQGGSLTEATDQGGSVTVNADGTFTYEPPVGFVGSDTFTYTISDGNGGDDTASVTIDVEDLTWYVDSSATLSADEGTSTDPFTDLRDLNGLDADVDDPAETIFLYQGNSDGTSANAYEGMPLETDQHLIGEPAGLTVDGVALVAPDPGHPDVTDDGEVFGTGLGIELSDGVVVDSVATVGTTSSGVDADAVGGFSLHDPLVRSSGATAFRFVGLTAPATVTGTLTVLDANTQGLSVYGSTAAGTLTVDEIDIDGTNFEGVALGRFGVNAGAVMILGGDVSGSGMISATVGSNDQGLRIDGGSANVTFGASIGANGSNQSGVSVNGRTGGTVMISGDVTDTGGGVDIGVSTANTGGDVTFGGLVDLDTGARDAVRITASSGLTTEFDGGLDIDTTSGDGISASGGGTLGVAATGGAETITTTTGLALDLDNTTVGITLDALAVSAGSSGGIDLSGLLGALVLGDIDLTTTGGDALNATTSGTLTLSSSAGSTIDATGGAAVDLDTVGTLGLAFDSISSTASASDGIRISTTSLGTFDVTGATTIMNPASDGIEVGSSSANFTFASVDIGDGLATQAGAEGINLDSNNGTFTINGGDITRAAANAFDVDGGTGDITFAGTIVNSTSRAVEVTARPAGAGDIDMSGAIDEDGTGINLANTGGTVTFRGGLDIDSVTATGLNAVGGTVEVCADASCGSGAPVANTIVTTTGTALDLDGVTIGAPGMTFTSVSAGTAGSGPANGIDLDGVDGPGTLRVTGTGSSASGGLIQSTSASAVDIAGGTAPIVLQQISIQTPGADGVTALNTADVTLTSVRINDWATGRRGVDVRTTSGTGTVRVGGSPALRTILDDTSAGGDGIRLQPSGASTLNAFVDYTSVTESRDGIVMNPVDSSSTLNASIGSPGAGDPSTGGDRVIISDALDDGIDLMSNAGSANILIDEVQTFGTSANGGDHGVVIDAAGDGAGNAADFDVIIEQSSLNSVPFTFPRNDDALAVSASTVNGGGRVDLLLDYSGFSSNLANGVDLDATDNATINVTAYGSNIGAAGDFGTYGFDIATTAGGGSPTVCVDLGNSPVGNVLSSSPNGGAVRADKGAGTTFGVEGLGVGTTAAEVEALFTAEAFVVVGAIDVTGSGFTAVDCPRPTAP